MKDKQNSLRKSRWHNNTKTESWAKVYQKLKDGETIERVKDGQNHLWK
jgi:hypothetical protein